MKRFSVRNNVPSVIIGALYLLWASYYIYRTSFTASNGRRYFSLFDDAMISMRYGWNLFHGNGLVWNPGERVEGITNLLMTIYMGVWTLFFDKPLAVLAVQATGIGVVLGIALLAVKTGIPLLHDRLRETSTARVLLFGAGLLYFPVSFWTLFGMETGMVSLLLWGALRLFFLADGSPVPRPWFGILLGLAFLTRPDTGVAIGVLLLFRWTGILRKGGWLKTMMVEGGIVAAFVTGVTAFRWGYYGELLPNTYTLKVVGMPLSFRMMNGIVYISDFAMLFAPIAAVAAAGAWVARDRRAFALISVFVAFVLYHITIGLDPFVYWRQLTPYVPMILVAFVSGLTRILFTERVRAVLSGRWMRIGYDARVRVLLVGAGLVVFLAVNWIGFPVAAFQKRVPGQRDNTLAVEIAIALNDLLKPTATIGLFHAGVISYYTEFRCIDFLGKSDRVIARKPPDLTRQKRKGPRKYISPGHNKYDLEYSIKELQPTYVEKPKWAGQDIRGWARKHYRVVRYNHLRLGLLRDSEDVYWEKLIEEE